MYLNSRVYYIALLAALLYGASYYWPILFQFGHGVLVLLLIGVVIDLLLLFGKRKGVDAFRRQANRMSNGDENGVVIEVENDYGFRIGCKLIDGLPVQFQARDWNRRFFMKSGERMQLPYSLRPLLRGEYHFGFIDVFVESPLRLATRRYAFHQPETVKVYPSYIQMRQYSLMGVASRAEVGNRTVRKLGQSFEFEQIKEYVRGDDYRTINWKATARRGGDLMVNNYTDERSQQIYCLINKGRIMKMPFEGLALIDYAINTALVLSNVALQRQDKAGIITFAQKVDTFLPADKKSGQLNLILETLYRQGTQFMENDFEALYATVRNRITNRSLLVLFTNFESVDSMRRELPALRRMNHYHLLLVVFFENTELRSLIEKPAANTEEIYIKTIADKYSHEKRQISRELREAGILSVLTTPQDLTINAINKYLELKNKQSI